MARSTRSTGAAIQLLRGPLASTHGYAAMWGVCGVAALSSIPFLRSMRASEEDRRTLRAQARAANA